MSPCPECKSDQVFQYENVVDSMDEDASEKLKASKHWNLA